MVPILGDPGSDLDLLAGICQRSCGCVVVPRELQDADCEGAQSGERTALLLRSHLGSIFVEGDVFDPMELVFCVPVTAVKVHETLGVGVACSKACRVVHGFSGLHPPNAKHLADVREMDVVV